MITLFCFFGGGGSFLGQSSAPLSVIDNHLVRRLGSAAFHALRHTLQHLHMLCDIVQRLTERMVLLPLMACAATTSGVRRLLPRTEPMRPVRY